MKTSFFVNSAKNIVLDDEKRKQLKDKLESFELSFRQKSEKQVIKDSFLYRTYSV